MFNFATQLGGVVTVVLLVRHLRDRTNSEARLARTDPLTGLANARSFYERSEQAIERQRRHDGSLSVAYLDLDGFKHVNDVFGHARADELLVRVGQALRQGTRSTDLVARLGGDEFGILYPETDETELVMALERVRQAVARCGSSELPMTFSMGGVTFTGPPPDVDTLLAKADALMYEVKCNGKNGVRTRSWCASSLADEPLQAPVALPPD